MLVFSISCISGLGGVFVHLGPVWDINPLHRVGFVHLDKSSLSLPQ